MPVLKWVVRGRARFWLSSGGIVMWAADARDPGTTHDAAPLRALCQVVEPTVMMERGRTASASHRRGNRGARSHL
ncbi:uncharacterized protein B0H18DRAFT_1004684 [Fomitopsis serialis]|uniref:uncharacterized protein n=1 Tax=Fomitopsis serialis TaxID=139415 RepID=UPI0020079C30|nr:uncharacterized protein B0H18DRAFT_1004684 [Neoantrodia serialis]KAH9926953.1 hypothetical protein B0H18DRAFT_1004684 [Neoantrodia serialis]